MTIKNIGRKLFKLIKNNNHQDELLLDREQWESQLIEILN